MEQLAIEIGALMQTHLDGLQTSNNNTLKTHEMIEYSMFTMIFEEARGSNTEGGERAHIPNVALPYSMSNHRNPLDYVREFFVKMPKSNSNKRPFCFFFVNR